MEKQKKYQRIAEDIKNTIAESFSAGEKLPSENILSAKYKVSRQTLRKALDLLEGEKLIYRVRGSGTYVNQTRSLWRSSSNVIGLISARLEDYIFTAQTEGIHRVLNDKGYSIQLGINNYSIQQERHMLERMIKRNIDGIIMEPARSALPPVNTDMYQRLKEQEIPIVLINAPLPGSGLPYVAVDDYAGGRLAAQYLVDHGHRNILGIFKVDDYQGHLRYKGFIHVMAENGLMHNEQNILWYSSNTLAYMFDGIMDKEILHNVSRCTGVFCFNDEISFGLLRLLKHSGIGVPEDVSVVGYDNSYISNISSPTLTTVIHPSIQIGEMAARNILKLIANRSFNASHLFKPELVEGKSVRSIT